MQIANGPLADSGKISALSPLFGENRDMDLSIAIDPAAEHAFGIERRRDVALGIERDDAAIAAELRHDFHHDLLRGLVDRLALVLDAGADVVRGVGANVVLAPAGGRYRALRVRVRARADDRRIADAAVALVGHAAGRRARGEMALLVEGDGANRAVTRRLARGWLVLLFLQRFLQLLPALFRIEIFRVD